MFASDALLLIGHGSSRYPDAGRVLHAHAAALRAGGHFAEVGVGLLNGAPAAAEALRALAAPVVHIVPFFMEDGYFTRIAVPRALDLQGAITERGGRSLRYCAPVGGHAGMAAVIDARLRACCGRAGLDPASLSVVLVGHGSARAPGRAAALRRHAEGLEEAGGWAGVAAAFLEEPPLLPDTLASLRGGAVAVVGFLAGEGGHARHDLPTLIQAERARRGAAGMPVFDLGPVGDADAMPRIILDQVARAAAG